MFYRKTVTISKWALLLFLQMFFIKLSTFAQDKQLSTELLIPFEILTPDSSKTNISALKQQTPVVMVYFATDCEHCHDLFKAMYRNKDSFNNVSLLFVTYASVKALKDFYDDFKISKFPNVTIGTEKKTYKFLQHYGIKTTPYIALFDSNRKMIKNYTLPPKMKLLLNDIKELR